MSNPANNNFAAGNNGARKKNRGGGPGGAPSGEGRGAGRGVPGSPTHHKKPRPPAGEHPQSHQAHQAHAQPGGVGARSSSDLGAAAGPRLSHALAALGGHVVRCWLRDGSVLEGVLASSAGGSGGALVLRLARKVEGARVGPPAPVREVPLRDLLQLLARDASLTAAAAVGPQARAGFRTDTDISGGRGALAERELQPWQPDEPSDASLQLTAKGGGRAWDQFAENERLFGVSSTYAEELYTTPLDRSSAAYRAREHEAARMAEEIERGAGPTANPHMAEERGLDAGTEDDEEARYGAVIRPAPAPAASAGGRYVPPGRRGPTAAATGAAAATSTGASTGTGAGTSAAASTAASATASASAASASTSSTNLSSASGPLTRSGSGSSISNTTLAVGRERSSSYAAPGSPTLTPLVQENLRLRRELVHDRLRASGGAGDAQGSPLLSPLVGNPATIQSLQLEVTPTPLPEQVLKEFHDFQLSEKEKSALSKEETIAALKKFRQGESWARPVRSRSSSFSNLPGSASGSAGNSGSGSGTGTAASASSPRTGATLAAAAAALTPATPAAAPSSAASATAPAASTSQPAAASSAASTASTAGASSSSSAPATPAAPASSGGLKLNPNAKVFTPLAMSAKAREFVPRDPALAAAAAAGKPLPASAPVSPAAPAPQQQPPAPHQPHHPHHQQQPHGQQHPPQPQPHAAPHELWAKPVAEVYGDALSKRQRLSEAAPADTASPFWQYGRAGYRNFIAADEENFLHAQQTQALAMQSYRAHPGVYPLPVGMHGVPVGVPVGMPLMPMPGPPQVLYMSPPPPAPAYARATAPAGPFGAPVAAAPPTPTSPAAASAAAGGGGGKRTPTASPAKGAAAQAPGGGQPPSPSAYMSPPAAGAMYGAHPHAAAAAYSQAAAMMGVGLMRYPVGAAGVPLELDPTALAAFHTQQQRAAAAMYYQQQAQAQAHAHAQAQHAHSPPRLPQHHTDAAYAADHAHASAGAGKTFPVPNTDVLPNAP